MIGKNPGKEGKDLFRQNNLLKSSIFSNLANTKKNYWV